MVYRYFTITEKFSNMFLNLQHNNKMFVDVYDYTHMNW